MRKTIILGIIGALLLGGGGVLYSLQDRTIACTEMACVSELTIKNISGDESPVLRPSYMEIDGIIIVDECTDTRGGRWQGNTLQLDPRTLNHTSGTEIIDVIRIGRRSSCSEDPTITRTITNITIDYNKYRPNGAGCPPTCLNGEITLE